MLHYLFMLHLHFDDGNSNTLLDIRDFFPPSFLEKSVVISLSPNTPFQQMSKKRMMEKVNKRKVQNSCNNFS